MIDGCDWWLMIEDSMTWGEGGPLMIIDNSCFADSNRGEVGPLMMIHDWWFMIIHDSVTVTGQKGGPLLMIDDWILMIDDWWWMIDDWW